MTVLKPTIQPFMNTYGLYVFGLAFAGMVGFFSVIAYSEIE